MEGARDRSGMLRPYVPRLLIEWLAAAPEASFREVPGSIVFVDISGFTKMSERLAKKGKVGAEEVTDVLGSVFSRLLAIAYGNGGGLIKFGGDALLLLFTGPDHPVKAARAAHGMRDTLRKIGKLQTSAGRITLRMSVGVHSGTFHFFLVGESHRELILTGPAASTTVAMEATATAGEILVSPDTAAALGDRVLGAARGPGRLLRREPLGLSVEDVHSELNFGNVDLVGCIPVAVRECVLAGSEPEHRRVTVAFVHFDGTDALIDSWGPEKTADALDELVRDVQRAVDGLGVCFLGTDIDRDGGKIILVSGAPLASEEGEARMLLALREIADSERVIPVRIGVNTGHVFAGDIGPFYRRTYTVMGDAVNLAARLMARAEPGQILATASVLDGSHVAFETRALEPFLVKGKRDPVRALSVGVLIGGKQAEAEAELPLVGRDAEMGVLLESLGSARRGEGRVVELVGDPGIGKSRLMTELRDRADGFEILTTACELYESSTPYLPFRRLLRDLLGVAEDVDDEATAERLRRRVEEVAPELRPWLPLLGVVLDVELDPTPEVRQLEDRFRKSQLEQAMEIFLRKLLPSPTLVLVDDVHWMDEVSSDLLRHLARDVQDRPWLVCVTRRREETGFSLTEGPSSISLSPLPLTREDAEAALTAATEEAPLHPHELQALAERSGGNPLFLKELLIAVGRVGGVEGLPDSIEAVATAHIDRLARADRRLLRYASVLGARINEELVGALLAEEDERPDAGAWHRLREFFQEEGPGVWRFRHAMMRDAAYQGLPFRRRRELHARVGDAIARSVAEPLEEQAELLSMHFFYAQRYEQAWLYSHVAGTRAQTKFANNDAAGFFERALESARHLSDIPTSELARVSEALGDTRMLAGDFGRADQAYRAARRSLSRDPVHEARLLLKHSRIEEKLGRYPQALRWVTRARRVLEGVDGEEAARQAAQLTVWYAAVLQAEGRSADAVRWSRRAIDEAEAAGDRDALAHAYHVLDWGYVMLGRSQNGRYSRRALQIYEELDDLVGQAGILNNLGAWAYFEGSWAEALELYARAREARLKTGDPVNAADGTMNIAEILSDQGRYEEAEALLREALRVWKAAGDRYSLGFCLSQLGRVASRSARLDKALSLFEQARAEFLYVGAQEDVLETDAKVAECLLFMGDGQAALARATEALSRVEAKGGVSVLTPLLQRVRGYALLQTGDLHGARRAFDESLRAGRARNADFEVALSLRAFVELSRLEGSARPVDLESESRSILERLGVIAVAEVPLSARADA